MHFIPRLIFSITGLSLLAAYLLVFIRTLKAVRNVHDGEDLFFWLCAFALVLGLGGVVSLLLLQPCFVLVCP